MKMRELIDALPSIRKISEQDLSTKTLYRVSKTMKKLENELDFYDQRRKQLVKDYCVEKDGHTEPKPEYKEIFEKEFTELLNLDITPDGFKPVDIPENENLRLSYADLCAVEGIFKIKFADEQEDEA